MTDDPEAPEPSGGAATLVSSGGVLLASRLVIAVLGWGGTVLIVRNLSPEAWGQFSLVFGLLGLVSGLTDLGVGRIAIAALLDDETDKPRSAGSYILLRVCLGIAGYLAALAVVWVAGYPPIVLRATALAGLVLVLATPSNGLEAVFQATFRLKVVAMAHVAAQFAQLALTVAIALVGGSILWFIVPAILFEVVGLAWKIRALPPSLRPVLHVDLPGWRSLLREAVPLATGSIFVTVLDRVDMVMLSKLDTFAATGAYGIAYKFADLIHSVSTSVIAATLPLLVRAWPDDVASFNATFRRGFLVLAVIASLGIVEFVVFAEPLVRLLYGDEYAAVASATRVLAAAECVHFFLALSFAGLVAAGRHRRYPAVAFLVLAFNVGVNFWVIPEWSYEGAAWVMLASEALGTALLLAIVLQLPGARPLPLSGAARAAAAGGIALAVAVGADAVLPWIAAGAVSVLAFAGALHVLRIAGPGGLPALLRD